MISTGDLMKHLSAGVRLVPFFKCVCVYFVCMGGSGGGGGAAGAGGEAAEGLPRAVLAVVKCAPVLCLLTIVATSNGCRLGQRYARLVSLGLLLSALGDACLVWPQLLLGGMCWFALAHAAYVAAFGFRPLAPLCALLVYALTATVTATLNPPEGLRIPVRLYAAVVSTCAWRGLARGNGAGAGAGRAGAGAALFLLSDGILGYSMFGGHVPYKQWLVMSTYYAGQLGIALSAVEPPPLLRAE